MYTANYACMYVLYRYITYNKVASFPFFLSASLLLIILYALPVCGHQVCHNQLASHL